MQHNKAVITDLSEAVDSQNNDIVCKKLSDILKPCVFDNGHKFVYVEPLPREEDDVRGKCSSCYGYPCQSDMCERLQEHCGCCMGGISDFDGIPVYYSAHAENLRAIANQSEPSNIREMNLNRSFRECATDSRESVKKTNNKKGFVYFASSSESGSVKIGSSRNVNSRMSQLSTSSPSKIYPLFSFLCDDRLLAERSLHRHFSEKRMNGEWFDLSKSEVTLAKSKEFLASIGIDAIEIVTA